MKANAAIAGELVVAVEERGTVVGGQEQVDVAVAIEVGAREPASDLGLEEVAAGRGCDVSERAVPLIEEQVWRLRVADVAADVADGLLDVPVRHHQVEVAVQIEIREDAAEPQRVS